MSTGFLKTVTEWPPFPYHLVRRNVRGRNISRLLDGVLGNNLDPITVRVERKGDMSHTTVSQLLLELVAGILKALAGSLDIVDADAKVAETAIRFLVAIVYGVVWVILRAMVVRELDKSLPIKRGVTMRVSLGTIVAEEVEIELGLGKLELFD